jgi:P4 family phage/plasmid primase-like protien
MDSPSEFKELLSRLGRNDDDLVTICYQSAKQKFTSKSIKVELADSVVSALDALENNIWFEINPSSVNGRATARDIDKLAAVYIDIDYKDSGAGSVKAAREFVELISELIGVGPTATVYSGHGIQPYWAIEDDHMDNALATGVLNRWGAFCRFLGASQGIQLDSVFDLPRIFRAPGSRNFKDAANPVTVMTMLHKNWRPITIDEINDVLIAHGITSEMSLPDEYELVSSANDWEYAPHDCQFTPTLYAGVRPTNGAPKSRHGWLLQQMVLINSAHRNGCITQSTKEELVSLVAERFKFFLTQAPQRDMHQGEVQGANKWAIARVETFTPEKLDNELRRHQHSDFFLGDPTSVLGEPSANQDHSFDELVDIYMKSYGTYGRTDAANARRLVYFNQGHYKFVPDLGWFRWENNRFVLDKEKMLFQAAIDAAEFIVQTPANDAQVKWAQSSINRDRIVNAITIAGTDPEVQVQALDMDAQPNDLCTPQGIVNLQTGEIRAPDRRIDLSTRQTTVSPSQIVTPLWNGFLKDVLQDEERIAYLQELLGSSLFGDSRFHVLPVLVGSGANGKSTLLDVVAGVLGDYAATMPENFLLDANGAAHPTEIARLRGVRFAMASETRPDGKFNESRVKMLTGGDTLSARFMNQNFFDFKPTHTLFLALNHLPAVKSGGDGFWRRLRKIDFNITIPPEKRKENLAQTLIENEGPGILQWMVDGAVRVTTQGFTEPDSVKAATLTYRHEEDHIAKFVDERIVVAATGTATKTSVFNAYRNWCIDNGEKYITQNALAREIRSRLNVGETDGAGIRMFTGIELVDLGINTESMVDKEEKDEYWR